MSEQSTFIAPDYIIDIFDELQDLKYSDLQYLAEYRELKMKKNDDIVVDEARLATLEAIFQNKIVTAARWNKFQNCLINMETYIKNEVDDFVLAKQQEMTTFVEQKKTEIVDYMDSTTAGELRNDIGVMTDSTVEGLSLILKTNTLKTGIDNLAGAERTTETVKGNATAITTLKGNVTKFKIADVVNNDDGEPDGTVLFYTGV